MTKPSGLYTVFAVLLLHTLTQDAPFRSTSSLRAISLKAFILCLLTLPWYLYATTHETTGGSFSDVLFLVHGIFTSVPYAFLTHSLLILNSGWLPILILLWAVIFREFLSPPFRLMLYCFTPYFILWSFAFSYDNRNLLFLYPILLWLLGELTTSTSILSSAYQSIRPWLQRTPFILPLLALTAWSIAKIPTPNFNLSALIQAQNDSKNLTYAPSLVARLAAYRLCPGFQGRILTDYTYLNYIPILHSVLYPLDLSHYGSNMVLNYFENPATLKATLMAHPDIHYFLLNEQYTPLLTSPAFQHDLSLWLQQKQVSILFTIDQNTLYELKVPAQDLE